MNREGWSELLTVLLTELSCSAASTPPRVHRAWLHCVHLQESAGLICSDFGEVNTSQTNIRATVQVIFKCFLTLSCVKETGALPASVSSTTKQFSSREKGWFSSWQCPTTNRTDSGWGRAGRRQEDSEQLVSDGWDQSGGDGEKCQPVMTHPGREGDEAFGTQECPDLHAWTDSGRRTEEIQDQVVFRCLGFCLWTRGRIRIWI